MRLETILTLAMLGLLLLASCGSRKPATATVPAVSLPPVAVSPSAEPGQDAQTPSKEGPSLGAERVVVPPLKPGAMASGGEEDRPEAVPDPGAAPAQKPRRPSAGIAVKTLETEQTPEPEPARAEQRPPSLKPMMTDAERRQIDAQMQAHIERARRNLAGIQESRLADNERTVLQEARSFLARAEQLKQTDLVLANSLAERAAILTQELLRKQR